MKKLKASGMSPRVASQLSLRIEKDYDAASSYTTSTSDLRLFRKYTDRPRRSYQFTRDEMGRPIRVKPLK